MHAVLGEGCTIQDPSIVGLAYRPGAGKAVLGRDCLIRAFTTIYADTELGDEVSTGHYVLVREHTRIGSRVVLGSGSIVDGRVTIGSFVKIEGNVYIPTHTRIGDYVFLGPHAVLTNDKYPLRRRAEYEPHGPVLEDHVTVGANATILPGVRIGAGSIVGAGSVVTGDVPPWSLAVGVPARVRPLPESLREENTAKRW
ncbi:MAG TPA: DapH/DapD/GlmU-related protein [Dehalococcoidia bacterium]|nr:DapH/DapD/GlmU-related protein [Dehalococcoidia bacterium]